jgi:hypothetical protein
MEDLGATRRSVYGRTKQGSKENQYVAGPCACGGCSVFTAKAGCQLDRGVPDWEIGTASCCGGFCTGQPLCVHPDSRECEIGLSSKKENPYIGISWDKAAPDIKCLYDLDKIDTNAQVLKFADKFGVNNDVEANFCLQKVSKCPDGLSECSRVKSLDEGSGACRVWFENLQPHARDAYMQSYCLENKTPDCACVLRYKNKTYQDLKGAHQINDGCWFLPCANNSRFFVPSQLRNPTCPDKICQTIIDVAKAGNVNIQDIQNELVCDYSKPDPLPAPLRPAPTPPSNIVKFLTKYKAEAAMVGFCLLILFLLFRIK